MAVATGPDRTSVMLATSAFAGQLQKKTQGPMRSLALYAIVEKVSLEDTLGHHGAGHFHEACNVSTFDIVNVAVGFFTEEGALTVDFSHD